MCADGSSAHLEDAVDECPSCGARVDAEGSSVEECCNYSNSVCDVCGDAPCDGSC